jgi:hypothetical protein
MRVLLSTDTSFSVQQFDECQIRIIRAEYLEVLLKIPANRRL